MPTKPELPLPAHDFWVPRISDREFLRFQAMVYREAGIYLSLSKQSLLVGRLAKRLRSLDLSGFGEYLRLVDEDPGERALMIECLCTHETHFFREKRHFEFLERTVFPEWKAAAEQGRRTRSLRVWSAGCSSGEEPYSLAMSLLDHFSPQSWGIQILATDLSSRVLTQAERAQWPIARAAEIPERLLKSFMLKGTGEYEGLMKAGPELRARITFQQQNLNAEPYAVTGTFDLILCCNVLIYFNPESRMRAVERLIGHLANGAYLMVGHAEALTGIAPEVRLVAPTIYRRQRLPDERACGWGRSFWAAGQAHPDRETA
jgi:chemotaxis protein methyltransferase CheR